MKPETWEQEADEDKTPYDTLVSADLDDIVPLHVQMDSYNGQDTTMRLLSGSLLTSTG